MADNTQTNQGGQQNRATGRDGVVIDRAKSAAQYITDAEAKYIVPKLIRDKFPDLVKLIYETESMNEEEREYWLQIMPIMSEDQITKFREILVNEKEQLSKLDKEYEGEMARLNKKPVAPLDEKVVRAQMEKIQKAETAAEEAEKGEEAKLLEELKNL